MKNGILVFYFVLFVFVCPVPSLAQITFERTYGDTSDDGGSSVQQTLDRGYIIAGWTASFGAGSWDVYLVKTDSLGDTLWTRTYGGNSVDWARSVQQTSDGGYILTGYSRSFGDNVFLVKTNSLGDSLWTKTYGDTTIDIGNHIQQTLDGGYIIIGITGPTFPSDRDIYLIKTDSQGDSLWTRTYGGSGNDFGRSVQQISDGGFIIAGSTRSFSGDSSAVYLIRTDSLGDTLWTKIYGGIRNDYGRSVKWTLDGGFVILGHTGSFGTGLSDIYLIKTDSTGNTEWTKTYGGILDDFGYSIQQTSDVGYIIAGIKDWDFGGGGDVYLIKTDSLGDTLWTRTYGGTDRDEGQSVKETSDGGFIIAGYTKSFSVDWPDVYLIKTDANGMVMGVEEEPDSGGLRNAEFGLKQNQPNPFSSALGGTVIRYQIPSTKHPPQAENTNHVTLAVYDITGRMVETLVDERQEPGVYKVQWEGEGKVSGIYFYRLKAGNFTETRKMTLLR